MKKMLRSLLASNKPIEEDDAFANLMSMAKKIAEHNPAGLSEFVRALLRPVQAEHLIAVAERGDHKAPDCLNKLEFFFELPLVAESLEFYLRDKPEIWVDLSKDIVLPTPWKRDGYANALANIGAGRVMGAWAQDTLNHSVSVWLPWRIAFVTGGNHSITAGILAGEGRLLANEVFDLSPIFARVVCDGRTYRETGTQRVIGEVLCPRRAAVFEIGRMMIKFDVENVTARRFNR